MSDYTGEHGTVLSIRMSPEVDYGISPDDGMFVT